MINENIPELTDSFLEGQDIFYQQFNDVNFYVEDVDQENLYYAILKTIFPDIKFNKIFPLNGKKNVIESANENKNNKNKIFIVDLDFDEILGKKKIIANLFYLERYSIENYLLDKESIFEMMKEKNPKLKDNEIERKINFKSIFQECHNTLKSLASFFLIIQQHNINKKYFKLTIARDIDINNWKCIGKEYEQYQNDLKRLLKEKDGRLQLNAQVKKTSSHFCSIDLMVKNIPGKYILNLFKYYLIKKGLIIQMTDESFTYKLAKEINEKSLSFLKEKVELHLK